MEIEFKMKHVSNSIASRLAPEFGTDFYFYEDPNLQGTLTPCAFIQQRTGRTQKRLSNVLERTIGIDIAVLVDYDGITQQRSLQEYAEIMDSLLDTFRYMYTENGQQYTAVIRCTNRNWTIDTELHYKLDMVVRVYISSETEKMQEAEIKGGF